MPGGGGRRGGRPQGFAASTNRYKCERGIIDVM